MVANAELFKALAKAQAAVGSVIKDAVNPHLRDQGKNAGKENAGGYASLAAYLEIAKPILLENGLSILTMPNGHVSEGAAPGPATSSSGAVSYPSAPCQLGFTTLLAHSSGESVSFTFEVPLAKRDAQGFGIALAYARRYCVSAWLNMWADDGDGEHQSKPEPAKDKPVAKPAAPARPVKELIEALSNAPSLTALDALRPDCGPYRNTEHWPSIEAVAVATKARLEQEAKDAAKKR